MESDAVRPGPPERASLVSLNVGGVRTVRLGSQDVRTAIDKSPVEGRREVRGVNVEGDDQADRSAHGGPDKSLYAYGVEDYAWWAGQLGGDLSPGTFGENLTTAGIDWAAAVIGTRMQVGSTVLQVTQPRVPCFKLGIRMDDPRFPSRFADAARPGAYLAIDDPGSLGAGDAIDVLATPTHGVTVGDVDRAYHGERDRVARVFDAPELPSEWKDWARRYLDHRDADTRV